MILLYTFLVCFSTATSSFVNFTNPEKDYSMDINANAKYQRQFLKASYMDVFKGEDPNTGEAVYLLTVLKTVPIVTANYDQLLSSDFKKGYLKKCDCEVADVKPAVYQYEQGVVYMINSKFGNQDMKGYSITFLKGRSMYNVEFYTKEELFDKYAPEFYHTINSFRIAPENRLVTSKNG